MPEQARVPKLSELPELLASLEWSASPANSNSTTATQRTLQQRIENGLQHAGQPTLQALEALNQRSRLHQKALQPNDESVVSKTHFFLADLQTQISKIDPHQWNFQPNLILRLWQQWLRYIIPDLPSTYERWLETVSQSSDGLNTSVQCLRSHRQYLAKDMQSLQQTADTLTPLLEALQHHLDGLAALEADLSIHDEWLFMLRQRQLDLQQVLTVNQQTVMSLSVVLRTHAQLIRAIDCALQVSVSALRTATLLAQNQQQQSQSLRILDNIKTTGQSSKTPHVEHETANIQLAKQQFTELNHTLNEQLLATQTKPNE